MYPGTVYVYILVFCRVVTGLVFSFSSIGKARDVPRFIEAVRGFALVPETFVNSTAILFLGGEFAVVLLVVIGGSLLLAGFALAFFLLIIFCIALGSALIRKIDTSCNCFGSGTQYISAFDLWRNFGFLLCTLGGCSLLVFTNAIQENLSVGAWLIIAPGAAVFVLIWTQLDEFAQLFGQS